jgi:formylglycine-generating enzyme required for sulfatase activity
MTLRRSHFISMTSYPLNKHFLNCLALICGCFFAGVLNGSAQTKPLVLAELKIQAIRGTIQIYTSPITSSSRSTLIQEGTEGVAMPGNIVFPGSTNIAAVQMAEAGSLAITGFARFMLPNQTGGDHSLEFMERGKLFMNLDSSKLAGRKDAIFRLKTTFAFLDSSGGRFYVEENYTQTADRNQTSKPDHRNYIVALSGNIWIQHIATQRRIELKQGSSIIVNQDGFRPAQAPLTKAEAAYDITCKLAALNRPWPSRIPDSIRPVAKAVPGSTTNSLGMVLVPVPGTKVMMCAHETRYSDFEAYLKATGPITSSRSVTPMSEWGWVDYPAAYVKWDEAKAFCAWLSQKEGKMYRLPTDEEWSHAVGIGTMEKRKPDTTPKELSGKIKNHYPWGNAWPPPEGAGNYEDRSLRGGSIYTDKNEHPDRGYLERQFDDGYISVAPVMTYKPNSLGIYDLGGNVEEWCEDWFDEDRTSRLTRGASYNGSKTLYEKGRAALLSSWREPQAPDDNAGFRVVMEVP